jgi:hypothetical protein
MKPKEPITISIKPLELSQLSRNTESCHGFHKTHRAVKARHETQRPATTIMKHIELTQLLRRNLYCRVVPAVMKPTELSQLSQLLLQFQLVFDELSQSLHGRVELLERKVFFILNPSMPSISRIQKIFGSRQQSLAE